MDNKPPPASNTPSGVVAFTGHMIDKVGRVPARFPKEKEPAVTWAIHTALRKLNAQFGFCSAACGGDIIFIEQMLKRKAEVHVVLPYGEDIFIRDVIKAPVDAKPEQQFQENAGKKWLPRFLAIKEQVQARGFQWITLGDRRADDSSMASEYCNRAFLGLGLLKAKALDTPLTLVALWDGWSGDAPGGTPQSGQTGRRAAGEVGLSSPTSPPESPPGHLHRQASTRH